MGCIQQADFLQPTDRALVAVDEQDSAAKPALMETHLRLSHHVLTLNLVDHRHRLRLIDWADELAR
jgi:hypothetical protein